MDQQYVLSAPRTDKEKRSKLNSELAALRLRLDQDPENAGIQERIGNLANAARNINDTINQLEDEVKRYAVLERAAGDPRTHEDGTDFGDGSWNRRAHPAGMTTEEQAALQQVTLADEMRTMAEGTGSAGGFGLPLTIDPTMIITSPRCRVATSHPGESADSLDARIPGGHHGRHHRARSKERPAHDVSRLRRLTRSRGGSLMSRATSQRTADVLEHRGVHRQTLGVESRGMAGTSSRCPTGLSEAGGHRPALRGKRDRRRRSCAERAPGGR